MTILALYFSGTGNTKFVVDTMCRAFKKYEIDMTAISIEMFNDDDIPKIALADYILVAYPVHGSMAPLNMWRFIKNLAPHLEDKKAIVIATQLMFSGDGGAYMARILRKCHAQIVSIEHFNMPSNLADVKLFKLKNGKEAKAVVDVTRQRIELYCMDFAKNILVKRGDSVSALLIGALNRVPFSKWERKLARNVKINLNTCTRCEKCVSCCPVQNLRLEDGRIMQSCKCIICYRCVNLCPSKSISILSKKPPINQYEGVAHLYE